MIRVKKAIPLNTYTALSDLKQTILTTSADGYWLALEELKPHIADPIQLSDTTILVTLSRPFLEMAATWQLHPLVFVQHICPPQVHLNLENNPADITQIEEAVAALHVDVQELVAGLPSSDFSIQTRILDRHAERAYQPFEINQALAHVVGEWGYALNVQRPSWVVSVVVAGSSAYLGASSVQHNLSDWAGGQRRFKRDDEQISRAEFKLLEALEVFGLALPVAGKAADLGAAPGGWTRLLRQHGLEVWAIDPGNLHLSLLRDPQVHHVRGYAQNFAQAGLLFDCVVNDMRMDIVESAHITRQFAQHLKPSGLAIMTMKLPPKHVRSAINTGLKVLSEAYKVIAVRQLFHNRHEVTVALRRV